jgi:TPR repeat protein
MHERGIVVEKNLATARQFYEKAVASGLEEANEALRRLDAPTAPKAKE